jgi:hypothetical protein
MLQDASGGSFRSTAIVLAVALVLGGLVMLTLRRQADKPVHAAQPETAAEAHRSGAGRSRLRPFPGRHTALSPEDLNQH